MSNLKGDERGAIYLEYLITVVPVLAFFIATWQFIELATADLILKRAASAAARAATVVLPDDPMFYGGGDGAAGKKIDDIELAAKEILGTLCVPGVPTVPSGFIDVKVAFGGTRKPGGDVSVTLTAPYKCAMGWASIVCGGKGTRELVATATYAWQGALFPYDDAAPPPEPKPKPGNGGHSW